MKMPDNQPQPKDLSPAANAESFVFLDALGKRWPRLRLVMFVSGLLFFIGAILFAQTLFLPSQLTLPPAVQQLKSRLKTLQNKEHQARQMATKPLWLNFSKGNSVPAGPFPFLTDQSGTVSLFKKGRGPQFAPIQEIHLGFYESWDPGSFDSLKANVDNLTHLCPDWLTIEDGRGGIKAVQEQKVLALVKDRGLVLLPLLRNMGGEGAWRPEAVEGIINGPVARQDQFVVTLKGQLKAMGAGGVVIDWEQVDPTYRGAMTALLSKLALALHADGLELWLCVPMGRELRVLDLDALTEHVDHFVAMLHDENSESDPPGPIASAEWFNGWLDTIIEYGESSQWVLGLGSYGYDWTEGEKEAETVRFQDVMSRAGRSSLASSLRRLPTIRILSMRTPALLIPSGFWTQLPS